MEHIVVTSAKRDGLVIELVIPRLALAPLEGPVQQITVNPQVIVRKDAPDANPDAERG